MSYLQRFSKSIQKRSAALFSSLGLFGTIGRQSTFPINADFIPLDGNGKTLSLTGHLDDKPVWLGLTSKQMQFSAYLSCAPLAAVIDRLAQADTNGELQFVDEDTQIPIKNINKIPRLSRIKKLLEQPNPWQSWEEFDGEQYVITKIFGYCPVFAIGASFTEDKSMVSALVNINPVLAIPQSNPTFSLFQKEPKIKSWTLSIPGSASIEIPGDSIIIMKDSFIINTDQYGLPISKLVGLDFSISNICYAMEADNVLLRKKGPLGVFSWNPGKDMAGTTPFVPEEKDQLQEDLNKYGMTLGQLQYVVSPMPVQWNPISFNAKDLMTKETLRAAIDGICDRFDYPAELMSGKNATYENRNSSEKWLYNNNIIPNSCRRMTVYNKFFSLEGTKIYKDFDYLPVMQEDIVRAGEAYMYTAQGLLVEWEAGQITWNQWQIKQDRDPVAGMDIYYPEYIKKFPNMNTNKPVTDNGKANSTPKSTGTQK